MKLDGILFKRIDDESATPELFTAREDGKNNVHLFDKSGALVHGLRPEKFKAQFERVGKAPEAAPEPAEPSAPVAAKPAEPEAPKASGKK